MEQQNKSFFSNTILLWFHDLTTFLILQNIFLVIGLMSFKEGEKKPFCVPIAAHSRENIAYLMELTCHCSVSAIKCKYITKM